MIEKYGRLKSVFLNSPALTEEEKAQCIRDIDTCDPEKANACLDDDDWTDEELQDPAYVCRCFSTLYLMPSGREFWLGIYSKLAGVAE